MPNIKSAKKRMRQNIKKRELNRNKKSTIRTFEKKVRMLADEKKFPEAEAAYKTLSSLVDKASKSNLVHKNTASRKKSRLAIMLKKAQAPAVSA